ncbi:MAG: ATP-grasp domain-containing protein [Prevotella sp.]|nr:ATP-grasp domain-containing protein [Prevotella sp.]
MNNKLSGKRLLVMGGMRISCEIVRKAKEMGIFTIVADYYPVEKSPAKAISDKAIKVSVTDVDAVLEVIKQEQVDGVLVGFNDMLLPFYADICNKAGLPCYGTKEQFEILIAKDKYKALCRQFDVPTIPEYCIDDDNIKYPVLVKPVDSSGSRGITICYNKQQMEEAVKTGKQASPQGKVLIERYMGGREVTVFWTFQDGNYYLSALGNRHVKHNQGMDVIPLPVGYTFPSVFLPKYRSEVEDNCKRMFHHLGIKDGMMFMQCKVEDGTCYVYDIGFRLTGSLEYKILERVCGYNPLKMMIEFALTGKMGEESIADKAVPEFKTPAFNVSCLCAPGTIKEITGIEEVKGFVDVEDVVIAHAPGETIAECMKGLLTQITVRVLGSVDSKKDLLPIMQKIDETIHIKGKNNEDLLLPGIEFRDVEGYIL